MSQITNYKSQNKANIFTIFPRFIIIYTVSIHIYICGYIYTFGFSSVLFGGVSLPLPSRKNCQHRGRG